MTHSRFEDDDDLLRLALRDGRRSEDAFMTLYRRHQEPVYRFALRLGGSAALAEDATQEAFLALLRPGYDGRRGALRSYLYGVARNQVRGRLLRGRAEVPLDGDGRAVAARGEELAALRQALAALSLEFREVVLLCELEGLSYEEAAAVCGVPVGTIRSRLHRARALLIEALSAEVVVRDARHTEPHR